MSPGTVTVTRNGHCHPERSLSPGTVTVTLSGAKGLNRLTSYIRLQLCRAGLPAINNIQSTLSSINALHGLARQVVISEFPDPLP
jgi:hypothetical protein